MHPTHPACALVCEGFPPGWVYTLHLPLQRISTLAAVATSFHPMQEPVRASQPVSSLHLCNGRPSASKVCQVHICRNVLPSNLNLTEGFCYLSHSVGHKHFPCLCGISQPIQRNHAVHPNGSRTDAFAVFHTVRFIKFSDHALRSGKCRTGTEHSII